MASKFQPRAEGVNVTSDLPPVLHILLKKTYPKNNIVVGDDPAQIRFLEQRLSIGLPEEITAVQVDRVTDDMLAGHENKLYRVSLNLDTDACDGLLMAMMARYSAAILLGHPEGVPERFLTALCNATEEVVGKGRNARTRIKGILHRREYWTLYERKQYDVLLRDARVKKTKLDRISFSI
jgi:hypothetical protein